MSPTQPPDAPYLEGNQPARPQALRVVVTYDRRQLRVASEQRIDVRPPPSDPVYGYEGHSGAWFELRDAEGRVLHRRVTPIPIAQDLEALSGDPKQPFTRVEAEQRGTIVLTMPALFASPPMRYMQTPSARAPRYSNWCDLVEDGLSLKQTEAEMTDLVFPNPIVADPAIIHDNERLSVQWAAVNTTNQSIHS